jgi:hypothetical protein
MENTMTKYTLCIVWPNAPAFPKNQQKAIMNTFQTLCLCKSEIL